MAASKDKEVKPSGPSALAHWMQYVPGGALLFAVVPLLVIGYFAWKHWGAQHLDMALYAVKLENIVTTPQPTWIRSTNVREDVFKEGGLGQLSLLDPQASATIAHAFESSPWVQRASRVQKLPNGKVTVDLAYRRPIAMVYYNGNANAPDSNTKVGEGYYPVDDGGVLLPTSDFDQSQVRGYFLLYAAGATPPSVGLAFSDTRIKQALLLCRLLEPYRVELRIDQIYVDRDERMGGSNPWILRIQTSDNRIINWGHAPGVELPGEQLAQEKISNLLKLIASGDPVLRIDLTKPNFRETKLTSDR